MVGFTRLSIRILALFFAIIGALNLIGSITSFIVQGSSLPENTSIIPFIIMPVCWIGCGILLWFLSDFISRNINRKGYPKSNESDKNESDEAQLHKTLLYNSSEFPLNKSELQQGLNYEIILRILILVVGLIIVVIALPQIISGIVALHSLKGFESSTIAIQQKSQVIENVIKTIFGAFLVFGFKGMTTFLLKLRA